MPCPSGKRAGGGRLWASEAMAACAPGFPTGCAGGKERSSEWSWAFLHPRCVLGVSSFIGGARVKGVEEGEEEAGLGGAEPGQGVPSAALRVNSGVGHAAAGVHKVCDALDLAVVASPVVTGKSLVLVYEISIDFRIEGMDRLHNPDFTML